MELTLLTGICLRKREGPKSQSGLGEGTWAGRNSSIVGIQVRKPKWGTVVPQGSWGLKFKLRAYQNTGQVVYGAWAPSG